MIFLLTILNDMIHHVCCTHNNMKSNLLWSKRRKGAPCLELPLFCFHRDNVFDNLLWSHTYTERARPVLWFHLDNAALQIILSPSYPPRDQDDPRSTTGTSSRHKKINALRKHHRSAKLPWHQVVGVWISNHKADESIGAPDIWLLVKVRTFLKLGLFEDEEDSTVIARQNRAV